MITVTSLERVCLPTACFRSVVVAPCLISWGRFSDLALSSSRASAVQQFFPDRPHPQTPWRWVSIDLQSYSQSPRWRTL